jgi:hypothetical protein
MPREKETFQKWSIRSPNMKTRQSTQTADAATASSTAVKATKNTVVAEKPSLSCNSISDKCTVEDPGTNTGGERVGSRQNRSSSRKPPNNLRQVAPKGMKHTPTLRHSSSTKEIIDSF